MSKEGVEDVTDVENEVRPAVENWPADLEPHRIEQRVGVYLIFRGGRWVIDWTSFGEGLYSEYEHGSALNEDCSCGDEQVCDAAVNIANKVNLPDAEELFWMLSEAMVARNRMAPDELQSMPTPGVPAPMWRHPTSGDDLPVKEGSDG